MPATVAHPKNTAPARMSQRIVLALLLVCQSLVSKNTSENLVTTNHAAASPATAIAPIQTSSTGTRLTCLRSLLLLCAPKLDCGTENAQHQP